MTQVGPQLLGLYQGTNIPHLKPVAVARETESVRSVCSRLPKSSKNLSLMTGERDNDSVMLMFG